MRARNLELFIVPLEIPGSLTADALAPRNDKTDRLPERKTWFPQQQTHMAQRSQKPAPVPRLDADKSAALKLTPVSRETEARLDRYVDLFVQWQAKTNLISPSTLPNLWTRHISDSLQLLGLAPDAKIWLDFGSGGGFPGVVLACAMGDVAGGHVHLVERNAKKAAFLREALRVTQAPGTIHLADIGDNVDSFPQVVDCITARAVAPLHTLIGYAEPLMKTGTKALFLKGQDVDTELTEATKYWKLKPRLHPSLTGGQGWIVELDSLERQDPSAPAFAGSTHGTAQ